MALILEDYDVSLGETRTSVITAPSSVDCHVITTNFIGRVYFIAQKKHSIGQWIDLKDENNKQIKFSIIDGLDNGINIQGLGGSDISFIVMPIGICSGTISFDVIAG
jgi:hypothetical protein